MSGWLLERVVPDVTEGFLSKRRLERVVPDVSEGFLSERRQ